MLMVIISSEICQQFIVLKGFLHRALMLTLIIILWECNRSDTKWYCSQEPDRFAAGRPFVKSAKQRHCLTSETKIGIWCPGALFSFFSLSLLFLSLLSHSTVASPVPVQFRAAGLVPSLGENLRSSNESQVSNRKWWTTGSGEQQEVVSTQRRHWSVPCY